MRGPVCESPAGLAGRDLAALDQGAVLGQPAMGLHVPVAVGVTDAQFDRVHADLVRDLVHVVLDREVDAGDAEPAHRSCRRAVGEDAIDVGIDVRDRVGAGQMADALDDRVARQPRVGAGVEVADEAARGDAAVVHDAVLEVPAFGTARRADLHLLLAVELILDGPTRDHGAEDGQRLVQRVDLAAEPAADRPANEMQPRRRSIQQLGGGAEREEQRLRSGVADPAIVGLRCRDGTHRSRSAPARSATSDNGPRRRDRLP